MNIFSRPLEQVISFEAPEVFVFAKEDTLKHNPTEKVVVLGSVADQASGLSASWSAAAEYSLLWEQVCGKVRGRGVDATDTAIHSRIS